MNKKGIELAASFIVVLIISIVTFGLATGITYKIFCASSEKIDQLDAQTEKFVEQKLNSGAHVTIPISSKEAKGSASFCGAGSVAAASYALGIRNDNAWETPFSITCDYKGIETDGFIATPDPTDPMNDCVAVQFNRDSFTLDAKAKISKLIVINAPAGVQKGTYVFTIAVKNDNDATRYGAANIKFIIT